MKKVDIMRFRTGFLAIMLLVGTAGYAQDYQAVSGSNHAGALGVHQNPASMVNTPYPWDITLVGIQSLFQTNAVTIHNYSLLSSPASSEFQFIGGNYARKGDVQTNWNILNTRLAWGRKTALSFGATLRSYGNLQSAPYNYADSIETTNEFFALNAQNNPLEMQFRTANWLELYGSVGRTLFERENWRLNIGATLRINKGLAGAWMNVENMVRQQEPVTGDAQYRLTGGDLGYGYSSNMDRWDKNQGAVSNLRSLAQNGRMGISVDGGLELLIKPGEIGGYMDDEESYYDYDWKFGAAVLDLGYTYYGYSANSRRARVPAAGISADRIDQAFVEQISGIDAFTDSVDALFDTRRTTGLFRVWAPTRLVLQADRFLGSAWYLNAELTLNVVQLLGDERLYVKNQALLRVTPRWETRRLGFYLPMHYTARNKFFIGGAFKAGPFLLGFHNLANLFSRNSMSNGGGYLALTLRPSRLVTGENRDRGISCPLY